MMRLLLRSRLWGPPPVVLRHPVPPPYFSFAPGFFRFAPIPFLSWERDPPQVYALVPYSLSLSPPPPLSSPIVLETDDLTIGRGAVFDSFFFNGRAQI